jgi:hypothetical protein
MQQRTPVRLRGIAIAAAWENGGAVTAVDIAGYDEQRYRVVDDGTGKRLRRFIKERLIVEGEVESTGQMTLLHVKHFERDTSVTTLDATRESSRPP